MVSYFGGSWQYFVVNCFVQGMYKTCMGRAMYMYRSLRAEQGTGCSWLSLLIEKCDFRMTSLPSRTIAPADSAIIEHITSCTMCRTLVNAHSVEKELRKTDIALNAEMQQWKANRAAAELAARDAHIKALQEQLHLLDPAMCPCAKPYIM